MVRIDYDDHPEDIIEKVNKALKKRGLQLKDDEQEHDGFVLLALVELDKGATEVGADDEDDDEP